MASKNSQLLEQVSITTLADMKNDPESGLSPNAVPNGDTRNDLSDMLRLGKKQEFKRNFNMVSVLGFISIYMATWEFVLVSLSVDFQNGGFGGLFWVFNGTVLCFSAVVASLAELESMAPTSGGQYHWVSEFAPASCQKFCSYAAGWMSSLGWLAAVSSSVFVLTTLTEAIIKVKKDVFAFTNWQYTLMMIAFLVFTIGFNTWGAKALPRIETVSLYGHIFGFLATILPLWILAPKNSPSSVFLSVSNSGGWSNLGTSCLISQVTVLYCTLGSDSAVHISEECEDASLNVPRAMWWSYLLNVGMGFVMLVTMLFCIGPLDNILHEDAPYLILFKNTGSDVVVFVLLSILLLLVFSGNITALASTSRELWAFSRDNGFPCSNWISKINPKTSIPYNAVHLTTLLAGILCLINLVSTFAFNIIVSLTILALLATYMLGIGCILLKRLRSEPLPAARWSLGRFGLPINAFAFLYCGFAIVFCWFPAETPVTLTTANWAPAVFVLVIGLAGVGYAAHGRKWYTAPVVLVEGRMKEERG